MNWKTYHVDRIETALRLAKVELGAEAAIVDSKPDGERLAVTFVAGAPPRPAHWREYQGASDPQERPRADADAPEPPHRPPKPEPDGAAAKIGDSGPAGRLAELLDELERESRRRTESLFQPIFREAALSRLFARLAARGFSPETAAQLAGGLEGRAAAGESFEELSQGLERSLAGLWRVAPGLGRAPGEAAAAPSALALIGAAGAGKTSTLAKLALRYGVLRRKRVHFVSVDPFRVGAVATLEAYASLLNLPLTVVEECRDLPAALEQLRGARSGPDWILIDTAGYGPAERSRERELHEALAGCAEIAVDWVISATERGRAARDSTGPAAVADALIFTRMDECEAPGAVFDESLRLGLPICFLTAGQNSLHDLIPADAAELTRFALGADDGRSGSRVRAAAADDGIPTLPARN